MKRLFDIVFAALGLAVIWPAMAVIAIAVKLTSPGPVLFHQNRVGRFGKPFSICKFRTMSVQKAGEGPRVTAGGDPRITPLGAFLRRHKLDELPQLLNVLRGEMSFVGPRPEVAEFAELFPQEYGRILRVRPGITHPGTVKFRREEEILAGAPDPRRFYIDEVMPAKIAAYEDDLDPGLIGDIRTIVGTIMPFMAAEPYGPEHFAPGFEPAPVLAMVPALEPVRPSRPAAAAVVANIPAFADPEPFVPRKRAPQSAAVVHEEREAALV